MTSDGLRWPLMASDGHCFPPSTAIQALTNVMEGSSVTDLKLHENELCGLWKDRVGGEVAIVIAC